MPQCVPSHLGHQWVDIQMSIERVTPTDPLRDVLLMHDVTIGAKAIGGDPKGTQGSGFGLLVCHVEMFQRRIFGVVGRIDLIHRKGCHPMNASRTKPSARDCWCEQHGSESKSWYSIFSEYIAGECTPTKHVKGAGYDSRAKAVAD